MTFHMEHLSLQNQNPELGLEPHHGTVNRAVSRDADHLNLGWGLVRLALWSEGLKACILDVKTILRLLICCS